MNNWLYDLYDDLYDLYDLYDYFEDVQFFSYGTYNAPKKNNQKYKCTFFFCIWFLVIKLIVHIYFSIRMTHD